MNITPSFYPAFPIVPYCLPTYLLLEQPCNSPTKENVTKWQVGFSQPWTESKGQSVCKSAWQVHSLQTAWVWLTNAYCPTLGNITSKPFFSHLWSGDNNTIDLNYPMRALNESLYEIFMQEYILRVLSYNYCDAVFF